MDALQLMHIRSNRCLIGLYRPVEKYYRRVKDLKEELSDINGQGQIYIKFAAADSATI